MNLTVIVTPPLLSKTDLWTNFGESGLKGPSLYFVRDNVSDDELFSIIIIDYLLIN